MTTENKWLEEKLELNSNKIHNILKSYFDTNKISSGLTHIELDKVCCLFTSKLLNTPDCVNKEIRILKYKDIFEILIEVYDMLKYDDDDLTSECYRLTKFFYTQNNLK